MHTPYDSLKGTELWTIVEQSIADLVLNSDLVEQTRRDYVVGYICSKLIESGLSQAQER